MKSQRIRLSPALLLLVLGAPCLRAQEPATSAQPAASTHPATSTPPAPQHPTTASTLLNPAISTLQQTLGSLRLDKWKASNAARQETDANISSINHDLETTLPPLLTTADQAPDSVTSVLPAYRNVEALYDVLLRIVQVSRLSAPPQQSAALEQALSNLDGGRRALGDRIQSAALAQDQKVHELQAALQATPPAPVAVACPPPPPPAPVKKRKPRPKPAPTPTPATSQTPPPATPK